MNWKRSATGHWVAHEDNTRYAIDSLACWEAKKPVRRYRLRVDGVAVGDVHPVLFRSVAAAKKYAEQSVGA